MSRIALVWESGSGLGHIASLEVLASSLAERGHRVSLVLKNTSQVASGTQSFDVQRIQSPTTDVRRANCSSVIVTYADILSAAGFDSKTHLLQSLRRWEDLLGGIAPDLVVLDQSPTAQLASSLAGCRTALYGTGFSIPPTGAEMPILRPWLANNAAELRRRENCVLGTINGVLEGRRQPPLDRLSDFYARSDDTFLATYPELDHFGGLRPGSPTEYWGITPALKHEGTIGWPRCQGLRIFAYLWRGPHTVRIATEVAKLNCSTILYTPDIAAQQAMSQFSNVHCVARPVDVQQMAEECDVAVLHGGHATLASKLLCAKPCVLFPFQLEQLLQASQCKLRKLAECLPPTSAHNVGSAISSLLDDGSRRNAIQRFADKNSTVSKLDKLEMLVDRISIAASQPFDSRCHLPGICRI